MAQFFCLAFKVQILCKLDNLYVKWRFKKKILTEAVKTYELNIECKIKDILFLHTFQNS